MTDASTTRQGGNPGPLDWTLAAVALVACLYPVLPVTVGDSGGGFDAFLDRRGSLTGLDVLMGAIVLVLVIEATRRTTGWVLPIVCVAFLLYAEGVGLRRRSRSFRAAAPQAVTRRVDRAALPAPSGGVQVRMR